VPLLFAATLFVSAFLLFLVQPMIAQMILPRLGGTPAVWNTCMVFFQAALLAGYGYTHSATTHWPVRRQTLLHLGLLLLPVLFTLVFFLPGLRDWDLRFSDLPFDIGNWTPTTDANPIWSVLYLLLIIVGLPFFVVATSAPLLQRWFVSTGHPSSKDPYFLYGASNLGSMLALISYPLLFQPTFELPTQAKIWTYGYVVMIVLVSVCGLVVWKAPIPRLVTLPSSGGSGVPATAIQASPPVQSQQAITVKPSGKRARGRPVLAAATAPAAVAVVDARLLQYLVWAGIGTVLAGVVCLALIYAKVVRLPTSVMKVVPMAVVLAGVGLIASPLIARQTRSRQEINWLRRLRWVALAAAPSSLMLGITTYMTTDIAAVPFFWIVPLALYLLSFILVFSRWPVPWTGKPHRIVVYAQPGILAICAMVMYGSYAVPWQVVMLAHLVAFFTCVMLCHGEMARDRPSAQYLTEFYLWMSVGGVLGGIFNSLLAPLLFEHVIEYFVVLVASLLLRPQTHFWAWYQKKPEPPDDHTLQEYLLDLGYAVCLGLLAFALLRLAQSQTLWPSARSFYQFLYHQYDKFGMNEHRAEMWALWTEVLLIQGIPCVICLCFAGRPVRVGLGVACLLLANVYQGTDESNIIYANRSFFSIQRVRREEPKEGVAYNVLIHGGIDHGRQNIDPAVRDNPISYFYPSNPIGQIFTNLKRLDAQETEDGKLPSKRPYAVVGLGIGTLASYGNKGQTVHFYEIDPAVLNLSEPADDSEPYFWYLRDAKKRGVKLDVILGDGRLKLKDAKEKYQVIVLDAFSSDAIPVHLMTKEAIAMYLTKLRDDGILVFNITNRYVSLAPVLADLAKEFDLVCLYQGDYYDKKIPDKFASDWVIMFPKKKRELKVAEALSMVQATPGPGGLANVPFAAMARTPQFDWTDPLTTRLYLNLSGKERLGEWTIAEPRGRPPWTDHFSDLFRAMKW
jgi:hypothetical protein